MDSYHAFNIYARNKSIVVVIKSVFTLFHIVPVAAAILYSCCMAVPNLSHYDITRVIIYKVSQDS